MIVLYTMLVAMLIPIIIWTFILNVIIYRNNWTWKSVCKNKESTLWTKFMYIWGTFWLYALIVALWLLFSYTIASIIFT